jgi:two-component sensor histidine kinase
MKRFVHILAWRSRQPALIRWGGAISVFVIALLTRFSLGPLHAANPGLTFYPAMLLASVFLGWREALLVLGLSVSVGAYLFLRPDMYLLPVGWTIVGSMNIAIISALTTTAEKLAAANERQTILFQEVQHRVANTLQAVVGTLEIARRRSPTEAAKLLDEAAQRFAASAEVHRRLSDPKLFRREAGSVLHDAVLTVVDQNVTTLTFDIEEMDLTYDQMSTITMLVIEMANNAQKHVFQHGHGSSFSVSLKATAGRRAMLRVCDDGPGISCCSDVGSAQRGLGFKIVQGLVNELGGTFNMTAVNGTGIAVEFPIVGRASNAPLLRRRSSPRSGRSRF